MIRTDCPCLDCKRNNAIAAAASAPIHRLTWQEVEPANEVQAKAWGTIADHFIDHIVSMPLLRLVEAVCNSIMGLKPENRPMVAAQVERFLRESPKYELRKGRTGGIFKRGPAGGTDRSFVPQACSQGNDPSFGEPVHLIDEMIKSGTLPPPMPEVVAINDHICPGCGNDKVSKTEKSCWKCGGAL